MRVISVASPKGGVGKTTSVLNIAAAWAVEGRRVLIVDLDWLSHTSTTLEAQAEAGGGVEGVLRGQVPLLSAICETGIENLWLLPSSPQIATLATDALEPDRLAIDVRTIPDGYFDIVLIDCPGGDARLTRQALRASDDVVLPSLPSVSGLVGALFGLELTAQVQAEQGDRPELIGILPVGARQGELPRRFVAELAQSGIPCLSPIRHSFLLDTITAAAEVRKRILVLARPESATAQSYRRVAAEIASGVRAVGACDQADTLMEPAPMEAVDVFA